MAGASLKFEQIVVSRMIGDSIDHIIQMQGIWHRANIKFEPIVVSAMTRNSIDQII